MLRYNKALVVYHIRWLHARLSIWYPSFCFSFQDLVSEFSSGEKYSAGGGTFRKTNPTLAIVREWKM